MPLKNEAPWTAPYRQLELHGGTLRLICEDGEDILQVTLPDGYTVDAGRAPDGCLYVTTWRTDSYHGFHREEAVPEQTSLAAAVQKALNRAAAGHPLRGVVRGVLFDMDGVLVDSERLYMRFWREASAAHGFPMTQAQALSLRSRSPEAAVPLFRAWFGENADYHAIRETRRLLMSAYIDAHGVEAKPGAKDLLAYLKAGGYRLALATSSPVARAVQYLGRNGLDAYFDATVSGTEVAHGKPAPDIYLRAASALGLTPAECAAVEDSPVGVAAAGAAGCFTVMVPDLTPAETDVLPMVSCLAENLTALKTFL